MTHPSIRIVEAQDPDALHSIRTLLREYAAWLEVDLCFQDFETELATLPGRYAPPGGIILLAYVDLELAGCVAMRPLAPGICEMKRLWVRDAFRGLSIGKSLIQALLAAAQTAGYGAIRLDTLPRMQEAHALYRKLGFREIPAYYVTPIPGTVYLEKTLGPDAV